MVFVCWGDRSHCTLPLPSNSDLLGQSTTAVIGNRSVVTITFLAAQSGHVRCRARYDEGFWRDKREEERGCVGGEGEGSGEREEGGASEKKSLHFY